MWQRDGSDKEKQYPGKLQWDSATGDPLGEVGVVRAGAVAKRLLFLLCSGRHHFVHF